MTSSQQRPAERMRRDSQGHLLNRLLVYEKGFSSGYRPLSLTVNSQGRLAVYKAESYMEVR